MTDQPSHTAEHDTPRVCLVPEGKRPTQLTVGEMGYASRAAGFNLMSAFAEDDHPNQLLAWAHIAWMWARRARPDATLEEFTNLEIKELWAALGLGQSNPAPAEEDPGNPSASAHE